MKQNCPKHLQINSKVIFCVLNNNFSYTQLSLAFVPQKDSYYVQDDTDVCFFFLLQKDFGICLEFFLVFFHFDIFRVLLFKAFLCFFDNIYLRFLRAHCLVVSDLHSETEGSRFESGC